MKKKESILLDKRVEVKDFINEGMARTFPAYLFNAVGYALEKVLRLNKIPHWTINAAALLAVVILPGIIVASVLGEIPQWGYSHLFYLGLLPYGYFSVVVCYVNVVYNVLPGIRDYIVDSIQHVQDLDKLKKWLTGFCSVRGWLSFSVIVGILTATIFTIGVSLSIGKFIGVGLTVITFSVGLFYLSPLYIIFYIFLLPPQLAQYHLNTYESDPVNSEVIQRLISILNTYLYLVAGYVAVGTTLISLSPATVWWVWGSIPVGWIPTILQFLINQYYIRKIIITAKWHNLNQLQSQIVALQKKNMCTEPEATINRINQLMDLHDRISARPNSVLNWSTGLNFLNQLLLPLLGLLIGTINEILKFLNVKIVP